jgi:hypothetical protein
MATEATSRADADGDGEEGVERTTRERAIGRAQSGSCGRRWADQRSDGVKRIDLMHERERRERTQ